VHADPDDHRAEHLGVPRPRRGHVRGHLLPLAGRVLRRGRVRGDLREPPRAHAAAGLGRLTTPATRRCCHTGDAALLPRGGDRPGRRRLLGHAADRLPLRRAGRRRRVRARAVPQAGSAAGRGAGERDGRGGGIRGRRAR
jgi:hypothetical protein